MHASLILWAALAADPSPADKPPAAGWDVAFPELPNYALSYQAPVVAKGDNPTAYWQTARYEWTGNDLRVAKLTLARDPEFKTKYAAEAFKKEKAAEVQIGKKSGWMREPRGVGTEQVRELIIPLADDKAVIIEGMANFREDDMKALAGKLDLSAVQKALDKPPRTDGKDK
jgi:hypothetical protein